MQTKSNRLKAYSYLRFSTPEQMRGDSYRRQAQLAKDYAERHGLLLDDKLTFEDLGVSAYRGRNRDTGGLGAFLAAAEAGLVERGSYLLVESLDRISRDKARKAFRTLEDICEEGITVVTLVDGRRYTAQTLDEDPTSLLMSILIFMRANEESATKARRLKASWEAKRAKAGEVPMSSRAPAWLSLDKAAGRFDVIEERAAVVQRIFQLALDGVGQHKIAELLNAENVPVFGRGKYWHRSYVAKILDSPTVIGTFQPHRLEYSQGKRKRVPLPAIENYYPAVIDPASFERMQAMRHKTSAPQRGRHAGKELRNLFGGLALCPLCGSHMTRVSKGSRKKAGQPRLVCTVAKVGAGCEYRSVPYQDVEDAFLQNVDYLLGTIPAGRDDPEVDAEIANLERSISGLEDGLERLLDALQHQSSQAIIDRVHSSEEELDRQRRQLDEMLQLQALTTSPLAYLKAGDLAAILETGELDRGLVNALLRQMMTGITVDFRTGTLHFHWLHGGESNVTYAWTEDGDA